MTAILTSITMTTVSAQMMQLKGIQFYDQSGNWSMLNKESGDHYTTTYTSENGTEGVLHINKYKTKKVDDTETIVQSAFDSHVSDQAWVNKKERPLTNSELQGTEGLEMTAYAYEAKEGDKNIWTEVWLVENTESGLTFIFTALATNTSSGISEPLKSDLLMMLGTIDIID